MALLLDLFGRKATRQKRRESRGKDSPFCFLSDFLSSFLFFFFFSVIDFAAFGLLYVVGSTSARI